MNNQIILWGMLVLPWLTLLLMRKEERKRWMPAALFVIVSNTLIIESGVTLGIWETRENIYPLNEMVSYVYGALPVGSMWILRYTYGRFWLYTAIQVIGSMVLLFWVQPLLHRQGIFVWLDEQAIGGGGAFVVTIIHLLTVYVYQLWQDDKALLRQTEIFNGIHPAAAKPLPQINEDKKDKD